MQKSYRLILLLGLAILMVFSACSKELRTYNTYARKGTIAQRDSAAFYFYEKESYEKAAFLFEDLMRLGRGGSRGPEYLYHFAYSKYKQGLFVSSSFYFDQFTKQYPNHPKTEECAYMVAFCYYQQADPHYLDQSYTNKALEQFQVFVNLYPASSKIEEANAIMQDMREKLAHKDFEQAKLYYKIENYKAAVEAFRVFIRTYPDSRYREESTFMMFKSAVKLADVSTERRMKNRYLDAVEFYNKFTARYPNSAYLKEAEGLYDKAQRFLQKKAR
ncbi:MAG: outer membrane protein assembly factor BamD [Bacteroidia bacterium]